MVHVVFNVAQRHNCCYEWGAIRKESRSYLLLSGHFHLRLMTSWLKLVGFSHYFQQSTWNFNKWSSRLAVLFQSVIICSVIIQLYFYWVLPYVSSENLCFKHLPSQPYLSIYVWYFLCKNKYPNKGSLLCVHITQLFFDKIYAITRGSSNKLPSGLGLEHTISSDLLVLLFLCICFSKLTCTFAGYGQLCREIQV
jgi:hypothetical protein